MLTKLLEKSWRCRRQPRPPGMTTRWLVKVARTSEAAPGACWNSNPTTAASAVSECWEVLSVTTQRIGCWWRSPCQQLIDRQMADAQKTLISTLAAKTSQRCRKMAFPSRLPTRSPERTSKWQDLISLWNSKGLEVRLFVSQLFQWEGIGTEVGRDIHAGRQMRRMS